MDMEKDQDAQPIGPVKMGPFFAWRNGRVARLPNESAFDKAAEWQVTLMRPLPPGVSDLFLSADYTGDIGRLYLDNALVDDNFFNGQPWQIGLKRFLPEAIDTHLRIEILPLRKDAPIYLDATARDRFPHRDQAADLRHLTVTPEYEVVVTLGKL